MVDKRDPITASVWAKPPRGRSGSPSLGRDQIVAAAIDLLDSEGLSGLTIRKLGDRLGSGATSIYWYVSNKADLLDLVLDECWGALGLPDSTAQDWRGEAAELARRTRVLVVEHPWMPSLFGRHANVGPNANRLGDAWLGLMFAAGFPPEESAYAASVVATYALGFATTDAAHHAMLESSGLSAQEFAASVESNLADHGAELPNFETWRRAAGPVDLEKMREETFEYGLARLLDGLNIRLDGR